MNDIEVIDDTFKLVENVSPGFVVPTLRFDGERFVEEEMVWGLIPIFNMNEKPDHYRLFNKRVESLSNDNQYFSRLVQSKRCVAIFDGFYEWRTIAGKKQPYYIHMKDRPIQMAAIYEDFKHDFSNPYLEKVSKSFSILTGTPCAQFSDIHNRQPIFLTDDQTLQWLDPDASALSLLEIVSRNSSDQSLDLNQAIAFHPVHQRMTDPKYQSEDCSRPISLGMNMGTFLVRKDEQQKEVNTTVSDDVAKSFSGEVPSKEQKEEKRLLGEKRKGYAIDLTTSDEDFAQSPTKVLKTIARATPTKAGKSLKELASPTSKQSIMQYFKPQK